MSMIEIWNSNYRSNEYIYGKEPNVFFKEVVDKYQLSGSALFPAEGEGRNAVYAATQGIEVTAFDISEEGRNKALRLAGEFDVNIDYRVGTLDGIDLEGKSFDVIVLIYAHFQPALLNKYHEIFSGMLNPGGIVILEGFSKKNLSFREKNPTIGGPPDINMLFSKESIEESFSSLKTIVIEEQLVELSEGSKHVGEGMVIRYIGRKLTS